MGTCFTRRSYDGRPHMGDSTSPGACRPPPASHIKEIVYSSHTFTPVKLTPAYLSFCCSSKSHCTNQDLSSPTVPKKPISISLDNTSVIRASKSQTSKPSQYLLEVLHKTLEDMDEDIAERLELKWIPGHKGAKGNEEADKEAKRAAQGNGSAKKDIPEILREDLPVRLSALRHILTTKAHREWAASWATSKRYQHLNKIDKKIPSKAYEKLTAGLRRPQTSIITQLRTNHIPLNFYLFRIKRAESPDCPHCPGINEDVSHFLFTCPNYQEPRARLREDAGRKAYSIRYLASTPKGSRHLLKYISGTGRFTTSLGELWRGEDEGAWRGEDDEEEEGWEDIGEGDADEAEDSS
jgi:hypothetical protein